MCRRKQTKKNRTKAGVGHLVKRRHPTQQGGVNKAICLSVEKICLSEERGVRGARGDKREGSGKRGGTA